jgi:hypothetical protein
MYVEEKPLALPKVEPAPLLTVADVLNGAADYIRDNGWSRWEGMDGDKVCPVLAINSVLCGIPYGSRNHQSHSDLQDQCFAALNKFIGVVSIIRWNECQTCAADVISALRETARIEAAANDYDACSNKAA